MEEVLAADRPAHLVSGEAEVGGAEAVRPGGAGAVTHASTGMAACVTATEGADPRASRARGGEAREPCDPVGEGRATGPRPTRWLRAGDQIRSDPRQISPVTAFRAAPLIV